MKNKMIVMFMILIMAGCSKQINFGHTSFTEEEKEWNMESLKINDHKYINCMPDGGINRVAESVCNKLEELDKIGILVDW